MVTAKDLSPKSRHGSPGFVAATGARMQIHQRESGISVTSQDTWQRTKASFSWRGEKDGCRRLSTLTLATVKNSSTGCSD